jgi:hypothetical protein
MYQPTLLLCRLLTTSLKMDSVGRNMSKEYHVLIKLVSIYCCVVVGIAIVTQILADIDP